MSANNTSDRLQPWRISSQHHSHRMSIDYRRKTSENPWKTTVQCDLASGQHLGTSQQQMSSPGTTTGWQIILGSRKSANHSRAYDGSNKFSVGENASKKTKQNNRSLEETKTQTTKDLWNEMQIKK